MNVPRDEEKVSSARELNNDNEDSEMKQEQQIKRIDTEETAEADIETTEDLRPKPPSRTCPHGIRIFTVCRQADQSGVSGEGIVIEGTVFATGQCVVHWLYPPPRGSVAVWDSIDDFIKVHIKPHPENKTIITYNDGETETYGD